MIIKYIYSKTSINEHLYKVNTRATNYTFIYETREKRDENLKKKNITCILKQCYTN